MGYGGFFFAVPVNLDDVDKNSDETSHRKRPNAVFIFKELSNNGSGHLLSAHYTPGRSMCSLTFLSHPKVLRYRGTEISYFSHKETEAYEDGVRKTESQVLKPGGLFVV